MDTKPIDMGIKTTSESLAIYHISSNLADFIYEIKYFRKMYVCNDFSAHGIPETSGAGT